jgi:hypothetical protein
MTHVETQVGIPSGQAILLQNLKTHLRETPRAKGKKEKSEPTPRPQQVLVIIGARLAESTTGATPK